MLLGKLGVLLTADAAGLKKEMDKASASLDKVGREAKKVGREAAQMGAAISGLGGLLVREAAKYDRQVAGAVKNMQGAYAGLAVELGRALVPAVNRLAAFLDRLTAAWRSLSDEQRKGIVDAAEMAVKLLAVVAIGGKLVSMGAGIASFALSFAPMLPVLFGIAVALGAVVTLIGALAELQDGVPGLGEGFQKVATGVMEFAKSVPNFVKYVLAFTVDATQNMINWLLEGFAKVLDAVGMSGGILRAVKLPTFGDLLGPKEGGAASQAIVKSFDRGASIVGDVLEKRFGKIAGLLSGAPGSRPTAIDARDKDAKDVEEWARKVNEKELRFRNAFADKLAAAAEKERKTRLQIEAGLQKTMERFASKLDDQAMSAEADWDSLGKDFFGRIGQWFAETTREFDRLPVAQYVAGLGQSLLSKMGPTGAALGGAIQGGMTAGPWGAIAGAALELLTQAKGFLDFMKVVNASTQELADALGSFLVPVQTFAGGMHYLGGVLNRVLVPVMEALGDVFADLGGFLILIADTVEPLVPVAKVLAGLFNTGLRPALELLFWSIKPVVMSMLFVGRLLSDMGRTIFGAMSSLAWELGQLAEGISAGLAKQFYDIAADIDARFTGPLRASSESMAAKLAEVESMTLAEARAKAENTAQTILNTEKAKEFAEQLTNVPAGFKVAAARYAAQDAGKLNMGDANGLDLGTGTGGLGGTPQRGGSSGGGSVGAVTTPRPEAGAITINGDLVVQGDLDTLKRQLKQVAFFKTGTPVL